METYDFVVIGGGSAGYAGARTAVELGLKTAVIDGANELGGLCILRGCMPSKTLIESANRFQIMREAKAFGLRAENLKVIPQEIIDRKKRLIGEFAQYRQDQLTDNRFELIRGRAEFESPHVLQVTLLDGQSRQIKAKAFLVATGSVISTIEVPGLDDVGYLTSDEVLDLPELPSSITVLGGGAIALELAHYYNALGSQVTVIQRSQQLLKSVDEDIATLLKTALQKAGMTIHTGTHLLESFLKNGQKCVRFEQGGETKECLSDCILMATGRRPNSQALNLSQAGVQLSNGGIIVDECQATSQPHIFAAGDVSSRLEVVHLAIEQGEVAATNAAKLISGEFEDGREKTSYRLKLFGIFTEPEVAMVGLTEREAKAAGMDVVTADYPFDDHGKSMVSGALDGMVKLIADRSNGKLLGGSVIGPHAVELIHEIVVAMYFESTVFQLAKIPHYHPTLSEIWTYPAEELATVCSSV